MRWLLLWVWSVQAIFPLPFRQAGLCILIRSSTAGSMMYKLSKEKVPTGINHIGYHNRVWPARKTSLESRKWTEETVTMRFEILMLRLKRSIEEKTFYKIGLQWMEEFFQILIELHVAPYKNWVENPFWIEMKHSLFPRATASVEQIIHHAEHWAKDKLDTFEKCVLDGSMTIPNPLQDSQAYIEQIHMENRINQSLQVPLAFVEHITTYRIALRIAAFGRDLNTILK